MQQVRQARNRVLHVAGQGQTVRDLPTIGAEVAAQFLAEVGQLGAGRQAPAPPGLGVGLAKGGQPLGLLGPDVTVDRGHGHAQIIGNAGYRTALVQQQHDRYRYIVRSLATPPLQLA
ncbi:hypothetical protein AXW84_22820 [Hymenobacter sp. PAMC 26628]|nr:hypothetical protein AXW84_22820 [Hymenobacter sp. PAMC 26628]